MRKTNVWYTLFCVIEDQKNFCFTVDNLPGRIRLVLLSNKKILLFAHSVDEVHFSFVLEPILTPRHQIFQPTTFAKLSADLVSPCRWPCWRRPASSLVITRPLVTLPQTSHPGHVKNEFSKSDSGVLWACSRKPQALHVVEVVTGENLHRASDIDWVRKNEYHNDSDFQNAVICWGSVKDYDTSSQGWAK